METESSECGENGESPLSYKRIQLWSDDDTRQLLDLYAKYMPEIGTTKKFKNKKDMWIKIASEISDKTAKQCEERYKTVLKRKKVSVNNKTTSPYKRIQIWSHDDTRHLLNLYANYMSEIGPINKFKNKKEMWVKIASEISDKTAKQCEERYKTVKKRKSLAIKNNKTTGSKRKQVDSSQKCIKIEKSENENVEFTKIKTVQETLLEIADKTEEARERRHKEKMDAIAKMLSILQKILEDREIRE